MSVRAWRTGSPPDADFERAWDEGLRAAPWAHFAFRLDYLRWNHDHGVPGLAVRLDTPAARGLIVARLERGVWVSGLPWRWMAAAEREDRGAVAPLAAEDAAALFDALVEAAGGRQVRAYLPVPPPHDAPAFLAGGTLLHRIDVSDEELIAAMDKTKRAAIRKAQRDGYAVADAASHAQFRGFAAVQRETDRRHGREPLDRDGDLPKPGERWREWELPWMWLLVAERAGAVGSGFGFALGTGRVLESRAAASTAEALRSGAFVLLAHEAARRARERGYRWLNWGGDTFFKRDVSGDLGRRVDLHCWLGGGRRWAVANRVEALLHRARRTAAELRRRGPVAAADREASSPPADLARPARVVRASATAAEIAVWRTHQPPAAAFADDWRDITLASPGAHFAFRADVLRSDARRGVRSLAAVVREGGRRGALVMRFERGAWSCGWPWRWNALVEGPHAAGPVDLAPGEAAWLYSQARRLAGRRRLRFYAPCPPPPGVAGYLANTTVFQSVLHDDDEMLRGMKESKRRMVRRARDRGYAVREALGPADYQAFHRVALGARERRGDRHDGSYETAAGGADGWREWELPWMWLLIAEKDGRVESGAGDSLGPGWSVEGRTAASTPAARRDGAFALLCYEEARGARDRGYGWINHGGDTEFKREIAGTLGRRVRVWCWLGGAGWGMPNSVVAAWRSARPHLGAAWRRLRQRGGQP